MFTQRGRGTPLLRSALIVLPVWIAAVLWMWSWWFTSDYEKFLPLYIPLTLALLYEFALLPSIFLYFVLKAKTPKRRIAKKGLKVAVISLCVPSHESLDIVENQLAAMAAIEYSHDSWILDEGGDARIKKLAQKHGVNYFTRKNKKRYNQEIPPFKAKTKAGNVNAWLDHIKNDDYDFFVQLDIDHIPVTRYLHKTLGHFRDEKVGWVQAPSIYGNLDSWTARGSAEQELVLQGPMQMGFYGHSNTPFIIGSHCTYRMSAIREIGGFQPTRAEDHLDTVYLSNRGYKGVFVPEIIATGDGPETLSTYLSQQFAWAYSMFQVLLNHSPKLLRSMPLRKKWQFLFAQTWYPLWALSYFVMFMSPIAALIIGRDVAEVEPYQMALHFFPLFLASFLVWLSSRALMKPQGLFLSWRGVILHAVRWPIILRAIIAALFRVKKPYMITSKGSFAQDSPSLATYKPFLVFGFIATFVALVTSIFTPTTIPQAQLVYALSNAVFMLTICVIDLSLRYKNAKPKVKEFIDSWLTPVISVAGLFIVITCSLVSTTLAVQSVSASDAELSANAITSTVESVRYGMSKDELLKQIEFAGAIQEPSTRLGMYNPDFIGANSTTPYVQHTFVDWNDDYYLAYALAKTVQAGNTPLITIEPKEGIDGDILLKGILSGQYDAKLQRIAVVLSSTQSPTYIRFAHEMELANLYAWGNEDPELYIEAYQYVSNFLRSQSQTIELVWSPAGNIGAEVYYPGDNYVDVIGVTILYDTYFYGQYVPSFEELSASRQRLIANYDKPVWIVEFGAGNSDPTIQALVIDDAISSYANLGFEALSYLNIADANVVGPDYTLNDLSDFGTLYSSMPTNSSVKMVYLDFPF